MTERDKNDPGPLFDEYVVRDAKSLRHNISSAMASIAGFADFIEEDTRRLLTDAVETLAPSTLTQLLEKLLVIPSSVLGEIEESKLLEAVGITDVELLSADDRSRFGKVAEILTLLQRMRSNVHFIKLLIGTDKPHPDSFVLVSLHQTIRDTISAWSDRIAAARGTMTQELEAGNDVVSGDAGALAGAWSNLIENARRAAEKEELAIHIRTESNAESVVVTVSDTGSGIPPAILSRIFDGVSTTGGGTGLQYVKSVVAAHRGTINVTSRPHDTIFTVRLPLAREA